MKIHQGDVYLEEVDRLPEDAIFLRKNIVQFGEITGHAHQIKEAQIFSSEKEKTNFVKVLEPETMTHEKHPVTEVIPAKKIFRVKIQKEYFPEGRRETRD